MNLNSNKSALAEADPQVASALWTFRAHLSRQGLRFTRQRRAVLEEAIRKGGHFDAEELHETFRSARRDVSLATVYRTLGLLRDAGLVKEALQGSGRAHYEAVYGHAHHDHMVCVECGKVIEFCDQRIEQLQRNLCRRHSFRALDHRMGIRGICKECRKAKV